MGGAGDEVTLRLEGRLEPGEQAVDRVGEVLDFVAGAGKGKPLVQVAFGDLLGSGRHCPERPQHAARHKPATHDGEGSHDGECEAGLGEELVEILGVLGGSLGAELTGDLHLVSGGAVVTELRARLVGRPCGRSVDGDFLSAFAAHEQRGGAIDQQIGDGQQADPRDEEEAAVENRQPEPHGAPRSPQPGAGQGELPDHGRRHIRSDIRGARSRRPEGLRAWRAGG